MFSDTNNGWGCFFGGLLLLILVPLLFITTIIQEYWYIILGVLVVGFLVLTQTKAFKRNQKELNDQLRKIEEEEMKNGREYKTTPEKERQMQGGCIVGVIGFLGMIIVFVINNFVNELENFNVYLFILAVMSFVGLYPFYVLQKHIERTKNNRP